MLRFPTGSAGVPGEAEGQVGDDRAGGAWRRAPRRKWQVNNEPIFYGTMAVMSAEAGAVAIQEAAGLEADVSKIQGQFCLVKLYQLQCKKVLRPKVWTLVEL